MGFTLLQSSQVVSYRNSTSNHNPHVLRCVGTLLYLIEILHQTTTRSRRRHWRHELYLIEILHQTTTSVDCSLFCYSCILSKFYIKPQLRLERELSCCVVSYRNSTSNHNNPRYLPNRKNVVSYRNSTSNHNFTVAVTFSITLYLIEILHQTTTSPFDPKGFKGCILSKFYIKPQRWHLQRLRRQVVSYRNSTSNHNSSEVVFDEVVVVSYRNSTSNHNSSETIIVTRRLYLIEILHQTTTFGYSSILERCCILSKFYIKPQHLTLIGKNNLSCILSKFYIKPQLRDWLRYVCTVVSYRNSTSNHNNATMSGGSASLYLIEILHQTTTRAQLPPILLLLYLIEILHQTTTTNLERFSPV